MRREPTFGLTQCPLGSKLARSRLLYTAVLVGKTPLSMSIFGRALVMFTTSGPWGERGVSRQGLPHVDNTYLLSIILIWTYDAYA